MTRRWRIVLVALGAFCVVVGLVTWNQHRRQQQFVGKWALRDTVNPEGPPRSISSLTNDGSTNQLMWCLRPQFKKTWVGTEWWLRGDHLFLERPGGVPGITSTLSFVTYWIDRLLGRGSQERVRVLEISPTTMRLLDDSPGALESIYERVVPER